MFGIFKKNRKPKPNPTISEAINECKKKGAKNVSINFYIQDQILFQVLSAKHFVKNGLIISDETDMAVVHFFNKNKTLTLNIWEKFKSENLQEHYLHYEEPKGNFMYIKNIGSNPKTIEQEVRLEMIKYQLNSESIIKTEYVW